jgi:hypothetical protein
LCIFYRRKNDIDEPTEGLPQKIQSPYEKTAKITLSHRIILVTQIKVLVNIKMEGRFVFIFVNKFANIISVVLVLPIKEKKD